jgi:hypothetical protein
MEIILYNYTDASDITCGSVLCQECEPEESVLQGVTTERPLHYLSHKFSKTQQSYSTLEKECFAVKYALEKFREISSVYT